MPDSVPVVPVEGTPAPTTPAADATPAPAAPIPLIPIKPTPPPAPEPINNLDDLPKPLRDQLEAEHKRGLQKTIEEKDATIAGFEGLRTQVGDLMGRLSLPEGSDVEDVARAVTTTLESMKTEREKFEAANLTAAEKLAAAEVARDQHLQGWHDEKIGNSLAIELGPLVVKGQAGSVVMAHLKQFARVEDGKTIFNMPVKDENGHTANQDIDAKQAVKLAQADVENWGFAFKATQNSGASSDIEATQGMKRTGSGELDMNDLSKNPEKFMELSKTNPELIERAASAALQDLSQR